MEKNNSFIRASAVLVASSMAVKILSAAYRVPLTRMLGAYAMGKYSIVFNLFVPFFAFSTAGITPAVSRLATQMKTHSDCDSLQRLKTKALALYVFIGGLLSLAFIAMGAVYAKNLEENMVLIGAVILAPNLIFGAVDGVYKGLTQGQMDMLPTAKANIVESLGKVCLGLGGVFYITRLMDSGDVNLSIQASFAAITASGLICCVYLWWVCRKSGGRGQSQPVKASQLLDMSIPISMSALAVSVTGFFDTAVCLPIIDKIPSESLIAAFKGASFKGAGEISMFLFGTYQGMVLTVVNLIPALLSSVGTVCLPVITRTQAKGNRKALERQAHKLLCTAGAVSVPMCMFTFFFSMDIIMVLFGTSPSQAVIGSHLIKLLIPCSALASFTFVFNAIFHAVEKSNWVLWVLLPSAAIKCALSFVLCQMPMVNIRGFAISTDVFYIVVFALSLMGLKKTGLAFPFFKALLLPSAIAYCMAVATQILSKALLMRLPIFLKTSINGTFFVIGYTILLILSGFIVDK